jgi:sugar phosphate isomerase/epimerase
MRMKSQTDISRRTLLQTLGLGAVVAGCGARHRAVADEGDETGQRVPLKIGIRAASMKMVGDLNVIKTAARIPGLSGVELQASSGKINLRDWDVVRHYKQEANRWGMHIPSLAGVWDRGAKIRSLGASDGLTKSIRAAEMLGASVILVAFFKQDAPDMASEESYGPIVDLLRSVAGRAADAGVVMGLENSLSPEDNKKLVDLVDHPAVGVYYDPHNMAYYGHGDQAIPGIRLLGKQRICMVHVKNGTQLLKEPGSIDWGAALAAFNDVQYDGWYIYESSHDSTEDCIEDTTKNNLFLQEHVRMPLG